jgi:hypothetical protein
MSNPDEGLIHKYDVNRVDGRPLGWTFVLEDKDPFTAFALLAYANVARSMTYYALADDLTVKARQLLHLHHDTAPEPYPHGKHRCGKPGECLGLQSRMFQTLIPLEP